MKRKIEWVLDVRERSEQGWSARSQRHLVGCLEGMGENWVDVALMYVPYSSPTGQVRNLLLLLYDVLEHAGAGGQGGNRATSSSYTEKAISV